MVIFLYDIYIFVWIKNGYWPNTVFAFDPNNDVKKGDVVYLAYILADETRKGFVGHL